MRQISEIKDDADATLPAEGVRQLERSRGPRGEVTCQWLYLDCSVFAIFGSVCCCAQRYCNVFWNDGSDLGDLAPGSHSHFPFGISEDETTALLPCASDVRSLAAPRP